ncbi:MAG: 23S rRNA (pseudouridine(1915)-N(3))-methyltransferase RlmH [Steroidobacteraceae bacterium]
MRIALLAIGQRMPGWVQTAFDDYAKRLRKRLPVQLVEIASGQRSGARAEQAMATEGQRLIAALRPADHVVLLDERGAQRSSLEQARWLGSRMQQGRDLAFLIGGPDGFAPPVRERADESWSLSPLTLPHALVRVVWIEQMYRAVSVLDNHPYHRE